MKILEILFPFKYMYYVYIIIYLALTFIFEIKPSDCRYWIFGFLLIVIADYFQNKRNKFKNQKNTKDENTDDKIRITEHSARWRN